MNKIMDVEKNDPFSNTVQLRINGEQQTLAISPGRRLIDILRQDLDMTGTKVSCEIGRCGACMVLVDGKAMNSCLLMAYQCEGKEIRTVESIEEDSYGIKQLFLEESALQCGYCTTGMIVSLQGYLEDREEPDYDEMKESLAGNLCRCTGYGGIHRVLCRLSGNEYE